MATIYTDENVSFRIVHALQALGHDVLTALEDGRANQGLEDPEVFARAVELGRVILTNNRHHYHRIHRLRTDHFGIITYTDDPDIASLALRIDAEIARWPTLSGRLIRIVKPNPSTKPLPPP